MNDFAEAENSMGMTLGDEWITFDNAVPTGNPGEFLMTPTPGTVVNGIHGPTNKAYADRIRAEAAEASAKARAWRKAVLYNVRNGTTSFDSVIRYGQLAQHRSDGDYRAVAAMRLMTLLRATPGIGDEFISRVDPNLLHKRLRAIGAKQANTLIAAVEKWQAQRRKDMHK